ASARRDGGRLWRCHGGRDAAQGRSGRSIGLISVFASAASFVIPSGVEEWSERDERHRRSCREGSGERVGRRTSQSLDYSGGHSASRDVIRSLPVRSAPDLPVHVAASPAAPFSTEPVLSEVEGLDVTSHHSSPSK